MRKICFIEFTQKGNFVVCYEFQDLKKNDNCFDDFKENDCEASKPCASLVLNIHSSLLTHVGPFVCFSGYIQ